MIGSEKALPVRTDVIEPVRVDGACGSSKLERQAAAGVIRVKNINLVRNQRIATNPSP